MKLISTRGWEEFEWGLERTFIASSETFFQFKLRFRTNFWNRNQLLMGEVNGQLVDIDCEFSQVIIKVGDLNPWLSFLNSLTTKNLSDLKIESQKEFKLIDREGEKLILSITDDTQSGTYKIIVSFIRGSTNLDFELKTDITCLTNYYNHIKEASAKHPNPPPPEPEKPFDFGGLPQRDLKKNLGCGA